MFGSLAKGTTEITGFYRSLNVCLPSPVLKRMGVAIENKGISSWYMEMAFTVLKPETILTAETAAITTRLISGILSAQNFDVPLTGDASIQKRPMKRIMNHRPFTVGADIASKRVWLRASGDPRESPLHGIHCTPK